MLLSKTKRETKILELLIRMNRARVVIACTINLLAVSTVFMTQSIFLDLSKYFDIDITQARYSFSVVSLFYSGAFVFLGPIADRFNLPNIALFGVALLSAAVCLASYVSSFGLFVVSMAMTGVSAAIIPAAMFPYIAKTSPENKIGMYMGAIVASGTLGVILGMVSMGVLTAAIGWQFSFRMVSFSLLLIWVVAYFSLTEKVDNELGSRQSLSMLYANSVRLVLNPKILSLLLAGFALFVGFLGMVTFLTYRLIGDPFCFSSGEVGWISFAGITALVAPFAGWVSRKVGTYRIILISLLVCLFSLQLMGWFESVPLITFGLLLLFLGVYTFQPTLFLIIGQNVPAESIGSASSLYILFCIGGGSLSSVFLGPVWRAYGWCGVTILCSVSLVISLLIISVVSLGEMEETTGRASDPEG